MIASAATINRYINNGLTFIAKSQTLGVLNGPHKKGGLDTAEFLQLYGELTLIEYVHLSHIPGKHTLATIEGLLKESKKHLRLARINAREALRHLDGMLEYATDARSRGTLSAQIKRAARVLNISEALLILTDHIHDPSLKSTSTDTQEAAEKFARNDTEPRYTLYQLYLLSPLERASRFFKSWFSFSAKEDVRLLRKQLLRLVLFGRNSYLRILARSAQMTV